jgi:hypothetical protein
MKNLEDYPYMMTPAHLADFLQVALSTAYERMYTNLKHLTFPLNDSAKKSNIRIYRDDVVAYYSKRKQQGA